MFICGDFISSIDRMATYKNSLKVKIRNNDEPWQVWLSGLSTGLQTERSLVQFPVRALAWVVGQAPSWGRARGNPLMFLLHISSL